MKKIFNKIKKKAVAMTLILAVTLSNVSLSFADSAPVVTLGANLNEQQKQQMLDYFGVEDNQAVILEVTNTEERQYLEGVASEEQLGRVTISCSYVEPTSQGSGINVKTANLTWVTSAMIATTLSTAGIENANVVVAAPFPVSGTGGLTGVMKAFEDATGESLDEEKKALATEELVITGNLGDDIGQEKATGVINDIKTEVIKNGTSDTTQIADIINNVTNNYNVTLTDSQFEEIKNLMLKISEQDYDYRTMKSTLENVNDYVQKGLKDIGEKVNNGSIFTSIGNWFKGIGEWFSNLFSSNNDLGILENTNDRLLGDNAQIDATDDNAINLPSSDEVKGFFGKIWNWITGLFGGSSTDTDKSNADMTTNEDNTIIDDNESSEAPSLDSDIPAPGDEVVIPSDQSDDETDKNEDIDSSQADQEEDSDDELNQ